MLNDVMCTLIFVVQGHEEHAIRNRSAFAYTIMDIRTDMYKHTCADIHNSCALTYIYHVHVIMDNPAETRVCDASVVSFSLCLCLYLYVCVCLSIFIFI